MSSQENNKQWKKLQNCKHRKHPLSKEGDKFFYEKMQLKSKCHGNPTFETGNIKNVRLDVELFCSNTNQMVGRPWITLLTDTYSKQLLSVNISLVIPSAKSIDNVLQECTKKHS